MPRREYLSGAGVGSWFISFFICGVYYLCIANQWDHKWDGILMKGDVYTDTSCTNDKNGNSHCSNTYYVDQMFYKGENTTHTCTIRRLTPYYFKGSADAFVNNMKLYTHRTIYQTTYSAGTCFDEKIRYQYNVYGGVFLGLSLIPVLFLLVYLSILMYEIFIEWYRNLSVNKHRKIEQIVFNDRV